MSVSALRRPLSRSSSGLKSAGQARFIPVPYSEIASFSHSSTQPDDCQKIQNSGIKIDHAREENRSEKELMLEDDSSD
jgi:hypothetical protein